MKAKLSLLLFILKIIKVVQTLSYSIRWSVTKEKKDKKLISLSERFYLVLEALNIPLTYLLNSAKAWTLNSSSEKNF